MNTELEKAYVKMKNAAQLIREARQIMIREVPDMITTKSDRMEIRRVENKADDVSEALEVWFNTDFLKPRRDDGRKNNKGRYGHSA